MAAVEPMEPASSMNREELHDAPVGLCEQVGITTEATYESLHNGRALRKAGSREKLHVHDEGYAVKFNAGDEVIMSIAGHVSRAMLSRYSHVRMEAKRRALDEIAARQRAADVKRREEAERRVQDAVAS